MTATSTAAAMETTTAATMEAATAFTDVRLRADMRLRDGGARKARGRHVVAPRS